MSSTPEGKQATPRWDERLAFNLTLLSRVFGSDGTPASTTISREAARLTPRVRALRRFRRRAGCTVAEEKRRVMPSPPASLCSEEGRVISPSPRACNRATPPESRRCLPYVVSPNCTGGWSRPVTGSPSEITEITGITGSQVDEASVGAETQQVNNWGSSRSFSFTLCSHPASSNCPPSF